MDDNTTIALLRSETIKREIIADRYRPEKKPADYGTTCTVFKCNLFIDDMARKYWGVNLPRATEDRGHTDFTEDTKIVNPADYRKPPRRVSPYQGWSHRPLQVRGFMEYLFGKSMLPDSGVQQVTREEGSKIATSGGLVVWLYGSHSSIMAPEEGVGWERRPKIYRQDPHQEDFSDTVVGVGDSGVFYHINPHQYETFKQQTKGVFNTKSFQYLGKGRLEWLKRQEAERESERRKREMR